MNRRLTLLMAFIVLFAGCAENDQKQLVRKSDYRVYAEYWFDKTIAESGAARAEPLETEFDFDVLPPDYVGSHRFKIRNAGQNPLKLLVGPKSCKCTAIRIIDREIQPGATGEVEIQWKTVALAKEFRHSGAVHTNDPGQKTIRFVIKGRVANELSFTPGMFYFPRIQPDQKLVSGQILVFSEEWANLEIRNLKSSFGDRAALRVAPMGPEQKSKYKAKSGVNVCLDLQTPDRPGLINGEVSFRIVGPERTVEHRVEVKGKVIRRLSLEETRPGSLTEDGVIHLGKVHHQTGTRERFLITVNDKQKLLGLTRVSATPSFVQVKLKPLNQNVAKHGVHVLDISIPPQIPQVNYNRKGNLGRLKIEFDHPRVAPFDLKLDFYVL